MPSRQIKTPVQGDVQLFVQLMISFILWVLLLTESSMVIFQWRQFCFCCSKILDLSVLISRANMPDKLSDEKANLAKKLAEQRAKGVEGIPTTAKVKHPYLMVMLSSHSLLPQPATPFIVLLLHFQTCSSKLTSLSLMSMRSKTHSLQQISQVNLNATIPESFICKDMPRSHCFCFMLFSHKVMMRRRILKYQKALDLVQWQICS